VPLDPKQDKETQSSQAADEIMRRIASLDLAPGTTFTERELAARLEMGKVPVREALLRLASNGLLTPRTGSGYTVEPITLRLARDVFDTWKVIEPACLELAQARGRAERMAKELRDFKDYPKEPGFAEFQFHLGLTIGAANPHLMRAHPGLEVTRLVNLAAQLGTDATCGKKAHDRLLTAMAKGDPKLPDLARENIEAVQHKVLDAFVTAESLQGINLGR